MALSPFPLDSLLGLLAPARPWEDPLSDDSISRENRDVLWQSLKEHHLEITGGSSLGAVLDA